MYPPSTPTPRNGRASGVPAAQLGEHHHEHPDQHAAAGVDQQRRPRPRAGGVRQQDTHTEASLRPALPPSRDRGEHPCARQPRRHVPRLCAHTREVFGTREVVGSPDAGIRRQEVGFAAVAHTCRGDSGERWHDHSGSGCRWPAAGPVQSTRMSYAGRGARLRLALDLPASAPAPPRTLLPQYRPVSTRWSLWPTPPPSPTSPGWVPRSTPRTCRRRSWPRSSRRSTCWPAAGSTSAWPPGGCRTSSTRRAIPPPSGAVEEYVAACGRPGPTTRGVPRRVHRRPAVADGTQARPAAGTADPARGTAERPCAASAGIADGWISASRHDLNHIGDAIGTSAAAAAAGGTRRRCGGHLRGVVRLATRSATMRAGGSLTGTPDEIRATSTGSTRRASPRCSST